MLYYEARPYSLVHLDHSFHVRDIQVLLINKISILHFIVISFASAILSSLNPPLGPPSTRAELSSYLDLGLAKQLAIQSHNQYYYH